MPQSKAHQHATNKWLASERDRITIITPKGRKAEIKAHAESLGMSLNAYINDLIDRDMDKPAGS